MAKNDNVEFGKFRKNIMGTLSFDMKLPNMRKAQDFIVYPVQEKTDYIMIQSDTRFGKIEMTTGRGLMSQSHANGAYAVHLHIDKLVKFELTESQLEKLKEELAKTAGRNVGSAGVVSDNEYADKFAKGGGFDQYGNPMGFERDYDTVYEIHHKPEMNSKTPYMIWDKMDGVYVGAYQSRQRAIEWIESNSYYAKGGYMASGGELVDKTIDHSGRYLDIVGNHRMLHIHLNDEGREMVMEERENGRGDEEIMYELFEDVAGNSDLMYHTDLGESGFGMISSSGVTAGYVYGDDGELEPSDDTAVVYVDNDSYRRSPIDEMLETHLVLKNSDFMAKGGLTFGGKMAGAGTFADGGLADDNVALFDSLKKGDTIKITFKDSISGSDEATLKVKSKTVVNKGKATESEKINFINTQNPHGVGWYAYKRKNGFVGFAWGDMAIWDVRVINRYAEGGKMHGAGMFADGGIVDEATLDEIAQGFTVSRFKEITNKLFPYSFAFKVYKPDLVLERKGYPAPDYDINGYYGFSDEEIGSKLYFPVYKRDHEINFNINQGGENTYFNFNLNDKDGNLWIGTFGFKDRGDVSPEYITSFIAFLMQCYGLPFKVKHTAYAKGGHMGKKTIEKVTLIFDGKEHKYDMVFIDGEFEEVLLPYSMDTPLFDYLEKEFDDWMDSASRDYHDMYFSDEAIYTRSGAIKGAIEVIDDTISEDRGKKKVYNLDKGEVDTMAAYS